MQYNPRYISDVKICAGDPVPGCQKNPAKQLQKQINYCERKVTALGIDVDPGVDLGCYWQKVIVQEVIGNA